MKSRRPVVFAVMGGLVMLAAWYLLLWSPRSKDIQRASLRNEAAHVKNEELTSRIVRLKAAKADEPGLRARATELVEAVPDEGRLAEFILQANDAANRAGLDFVSIAPVRPALAIPIPGSPVGASSPPEVKFALQMAGGYGPVLDFLDRLAALPRLVVVDGVNLAADATGRITTGLTARMFVQPTAVRPPAGTVGAVAAPAATTGAGR